MPFAALWNACRMNSREMLGDFFRAGDSPTGSACISCAREIHLVNTHDSLAAMVGGRSFYGGWRWTTRASVHERE